MIRIKRNSVTKKKIISMKWTVLLDLIEVCAHVLWSYWSLMATATFNHSLLWQAVLPNRNAWVIRTVKCKLCPAEKPLNRVQSHNHTVKALTADTPGFIKLYSYDLLEGFNTKCSRFRQLALYAFFFFFHFSSICEHFPNYFVYVEMVMNQK